MSTGICGAATVRDMNMFRLFDLTAGQVGEMAELVVLYS